MKNPPAKRWPNPFNNKCEYVTSTERAIEIFRSFKNLPKLPAMDTETEVEYDAAGKALGPDPLKARLAVISLACRRDLSKGPEHDEAYVFFTRDMDFDALLAVLDELDLEFYGWNAGFDDPVVSTNLRKAHGEIGWKFRPIVRWRDLMIGESLLRLGREGHTWHEGLAGAARRRLGIDVEGKGTVQLSYKVDVAPDQEQINYAASDALVTLWLSDEIEGDIEKADIWGTWERGYKSRVIWQEMEINGFPYQKDEWLTWLRKDVDEQIAEIETRLADITNEFQEDLFGGRHLKWKPSSEHDVRRILNEHAAEQVMTYTATWLDGDGKAPATPDDIDEDDEKNSAPVGRLLIPGESVDKTALGLMGGELAGLILKWRQVSKNWTTYGPRWCNHVKEDGRVHAQYTQALTATNRASSKSPNAQNEQKAQKRVIRNSNPFIVQLAADFSQAELRAMAQLWNEQSMIDAFYNDIDQHTYTAQTMFSLPMLELKAKGDAGDKEAAALYKSARGKAKGIAFGLPYGMRGKRLAMSLTLNGNPTTPTEADELIESFLAAKPGIKKGLEERDGFVEQIANDIKAGKRYKFDWKATWRLLDLMDRIATAVKQLKADGIKNPDNLMIAERLDNRQSVEGKLTEQFGRQATAEEIDAAINENAAQVGWARNFLAPVVLLEDGTPFSFEGRTAANDRRLFEVSAEQWMASMAMTAATSRKPGPQAITKEWAKKGNHKLFEIDKETGQEKVISRARLKKFFENKFVRRAYVGHVLAKMPAAADFLARQGVADQVRSKANQYRNVPVQGIVASVVQLSMANWWERRGIHGSVRMVKSVHDSLVAEVSVQEAVPALRLLKDTMEEGLRTFCPDVKCVADADIQLSYDEKSILAIEDVPAYLEKLLQTVVDKAAEAKKLEADLAAATLAHGETSEEARAARQMAVAARADADQWAAWQAESEERMATPISRVTQEYVPQAA